MKKKILLQELAEHFAAREGLTKKKAELFVRTFFDLIEQGIFEDKFVKIKGFGTFKLVAVGERESVNIKTGERIQIGGHSKMAFVPDTALKEMVNKPFAHFETVDLNDDTTQQELDAIDKESATWETNDEADDEEEMLIAVTEAQPTPSAQEAADTDSSAPSAQPTQPEKVEADDETPAETPITVHVPANKDEVTDEPQTLTATEHHTTVKPASEEMPVETKTEQQEETPAEVGDIATSPQTTIEQPASAPGAETYANDTEQEIIVSEPTPINNQPELAQATTAAEPFTYTYTEKSNKKLYRALKWAGLILFMILLSVSSYFAGYYRLLCPCNFFDTVTLNDSPAAQQEAVRQTVRSATPATPPASRHTDSLTTKPQAKQAKSASHDTTHVAQSTKATTHPSAPKQSVSAKPAKEDSKQSDTDAAPQNIYYKVKPGDNLSRIARRYYGTDTMVPTILRHNRLRNADNITIGQTLVLPAQGMKQ